ncbi:MAG: hypothetical protein ACRDRN_24665, partial [Sciscionella sp.]
AVATVERRIAGLPPHVFAIALCALAAMVKAPAAAGVVFLAISRARRQPTFRAGAARLTVSALVAGAVVAAVSLATGVGWSWLNPEALTSPDLATTPFTPVTSLTYTTAWVAHAFGIAIPIGKIMAALQPAGMVVAGTFALALLWRQHRIGLTRALALTLLAVVLASPVTWPWYLSWGVVLLAAAMPARRVLGPIVLATIPLLLIQPDGIPHPFTRAATVGFAIGSLALLLYASYWSYRHLVKSPPPAPVGSTA